MGFDRYSMLIDGRRLVIWSGEIHPFRLPSPSLWRDVLQKLRAHGYNAISIYVAWNYHSPAPGQFDFTGVRDLDLFLRTAAETGLYVILRPGPYINAEVDAGGFPGWLTVTRGTARTSDPTYLRHVDAWLTAVDRIAARHLYTDGGGTIVLYQVENEYDNHVTEAAGRDYMAHLYAKVRADGIDVPLFHNDKGRNGHWAPGTFDTGGERGRYLYGFDGYPSPSRRRRTGATSAPAVRRAARPPARTPRASSPSSGAAGSIHGAGPSSTARGTRSPAAPGTRPTSGASTSPTSPTASRSTTST